MADKPKSEQTTGTGEETSLERAISNYLGVGIHLFLSVLALLLLVAAIITTYDTVVQEFPSLWKKPEDEYVVLLKIIENILLIAIAAEFALILLFQRMSAVVEVMVFVLAREAVNPKVTAFELVLCVAAIAGLVVVRHYYLPGKTT